MEQQNVTFNIFLFPLSHNLPFDHQLIEWLHLQSDNAHV